MKAKLSELNKATEKAYATIEEVEKSREQIRILGETLTVQQALGVMKANRYVGADFLAERAKSVRILMDTLEKIGASPDARQEISDAAANYIRIDLNEGAYDAVCDALRSSKNDAAKALMANPNEFRQVFFDRFINVYNLKKTPQDLFLFLEEKNVDVTDDVKSAFLRLDTFLSEGILLDLRGNRILQVINPPASITV